MHPFNFKLSGKNVLFIGGGDVASRKVRSLLSTSTPQLTVVSPQITEYLLSLQTAGLINWLPRVAEINDVQDSIFMLFICTNDSKVNSFFADIALEKSILVNIADDPKRSSFHTSAVVQNDETIIAINSKSQDPKISVEWKKKVAKLF